MDQQSTNQNAPKRAYTAEEIARLEAEAVAAMQRGEPVPARQAPEAVPEAARETGGAPGAAPRGFVPYVDDVPDAPPSETPGEDDEDDDEDDESYIPGAMEARIDAMTPKQWRYWQIAGGAAVGLASVSCLFVFGEELATYGLIVAVLLAVLLPRYLERAWRHRLTTARYAMVIAMVVGLVAMGIVIAARGGFAVKTAP